VHEVTYGVRIKLTVYWLIRCVYHRIAGRIHAFWHDNYWFFRFWMWVRIFFVLEWAQYRFLFYFITFFLFYDISVTMVTVLAHYLFMILCFYRGDRGDTTSFRMNSCIDFMLELKVIIAIIYLQIICFSYS
jgi:hypothetical protein